MRSRCRDGGGKPVRSLLTRNCGEEGALGELLVTTDLMLRGYQVFRAVSPSSDYDLLILKGPSIFRVEVTKGHRKGKDSKLGWPRHTKAYDILAVWEPDRVITYFPDITTQF